MGTYQEVKVSQVTGDVVLSYSKDVTYITIGGEDQHLQMIYPSKTEKEKNYPGILYVLEGAEDKEAIYNKILCLAKFAQRGYVVAMVAASVESDNGPENTFDAALEFLHKNASLYRLNTEYLFVLRDAIAISEPMDTLVIKELEEKQQFKGIKAIISFGGKDELKKLSNDTLDCPPILCMSGNNELSEQKLYWSEDNLDYLEDFMSNYI